MQKTNYFVIAILIGMSILVCSEIVFAESKAQSIELKYGYKLILDSDKYIKRTKMGSIVFYGSNGRIINHFSQDSKLKRSPDGKIFIISKEIFIPLGNYKDIVNDDCKSLHP